MGFSDPSEVPLDKNLFQLGMDSLMAVDFSVRVTKSVAKVSPADVFECGTIATLAAKLSSQSELSPSSDDPSARSSESAPLELERLGYQDGLEDALVRFAAREWPARRSEWVVPRWKWMFAESARRVGVDPRVWIFREQDEIVAHMGAIPVRLKVGGETHIVPWLVDTMVAKTHRDRALGSELILQAKEDCPFSLSLGQTAYVRQILERLGWKQIAPLKTFTYLLRPHRVAKGKLRIPGLREGAAAALLAKQLWQNKSRGEMDGRLVSREVSRFGAEHDDLWSRVANHYTCAVVRDASYLNWKYVDQPGQDFVRLEIHRDNDLVGVVVVQVRPPDSVYPYSRGFVVDMVVDPTDRGAVLGACDAATTSLRDRGADLAVFYLINDALEQRIREFGFWEREPTRYLWMVADTLNNSQVSILKQPDSWLITMGDSDIDRPE